MDAVWKGINWKDIIVRESILSKDFNMGQKSGLTEKWEPILLGHRQ